MILDNKNKRAGLCRVFPSEPELTFPLGRDGPQQVEKNEDEGHIQSRVCT